MPSMEDHKINPEREEAYRRGYAHGIAATISGVAECLSADQRRRLEVWFANELTPWMTGYAPNKPPLFPGLDPNA